MATDPETSTHAPRASYFGTAVVVFVYDDAGLLLMVRRVDTDWYAVPSGSQELGETVAQAVVRVVLEQTGVDVEVTGLVGVHSRHVGDEGGLALCFRARPVAGSLRTTEAGAQVVWVEPEHLGELNIDSDIRRRIEHCAYAEPEQFYA